MWLIRKLLAFIRIRRIASVVFNDDRARDGMVVGERRNHLRIRTLCIWGVHGYWWEQWVQKDDPAIRNLCWSLGSRVVGYAAVCLMIMVVISVIMNMDFPIHNQIAGTEIDHHTGLPIAGHIIYPEQLSDGHYSVSRALLHGETAVVRHLPGGKDFIYLVANRSVANVPNKCRPGDRFTVFRRSVVSMDK